MDCTYRKEIKYVISRYQYYLMRRDLSVFMSLDSHGSRDGYMVRSLYFDSYTNQDLFDTLSGAMHKAKVRLRLYSHSDQKIKLEYKQKSGSDSLKRSLSLPRNLAEKMVDNDYTFFREMQDPLAVELFLRMCGGSYTPVSTVQYNRVAYHYPVCDVRITFDTDIRASCMKSTFFEENPTLYPLMPGDKGVLEVKYSGFLPGVFKDIVSTIEASPLANSKYGYSRMFF